MGAWVAGFKVVRDEGGAEGADHEIVVVEGGDDGGGVCAVKRCGDVRGWHVVSILPMDWIGLDRIETGTR